MKKILVSFLMLLLLSSLCACGNESVQADGSDQSTKVVPDCAIAWGEADWTTEALPVDDLSTIALTIEMLQEQANAYRRATVECSVDFGSFSKETIVADASCLTSEEIQQIEVTDAEDGNSGTVSAEDALADIELLSRILQSSYGSYYLYDRADWDAATTQMQDYIKSSGKKTFSTTDLCEELLRAYSFVNDDHFRFNGRSTLDYNNGVLYYNYLRDIDFRRDEHGYFTQKDGFKWYVTAVNGESIDNYMKPTITQEGELVYAIGTFLAESASKDGTITLSRGDVTNTVSCQFTTAQSLRDMQGDLGLTQAGLYDGYYVMGIRSFPVLDLSPEEESALKKYPEMAKKLQGTSNFIIDSRGNDGGGDIWLAGLYENLTGVNFRLTINEVRRVSELTKRRYDTGEPLGLAENRVDGSYAENDSLFLYLIDKDVASAGERGICSILQMDNALLVGTNSRGCVLGGGGVYVLPHSGIHVNSGDAAFIEHNCTSEIEGLGWMPDIYVDGYLALDRAIAMYQYYGLRPDANASDLDCWGEEIKRFNEDLPPPADLRVIWNGFEIIPGQCFGDIVGENNYVDVIADGNIVTDFSVASEDSMKLGAERTKDGKVKLSKLSSFDGGKVPFTITYQGHEFTFNCNDDTWVVN